MKKLILTLAFSMTAVICINAQDVYKEIMRLSKEVANDTSKDLQTRRIATFKVDELEYMAQRTMEQMPDSSASILNYQAYAMYEYVNLFLKNYTATDKKKEKLDVVDTFMNASIQNPRFNDKDKELVMSYINAEGYVTKFSLDTDWVKALADVKEKLKAVRGQ